MNWLYGFMIVGYTIFVYRIYLALRRGREFEYKQACEKQRRRDLWRNLRG